MPALIFTKKNRAFMQKVCDALLRIAGMVVLKGAHWCTGKFNQLVTPTEFRVPAAILTAIAYIVFWFIDIYLLWDILKVFFPQVHIPNLPVFTGFSTVPKRRTQFAETFSTEKQDLDSKANLEESIPEMSTQTEQSIESAQSNSSVIFNTINRTDPGSEIDPTRLEIAHDEE